MAGRILGTKTCIDGKQYEYWPAGTTPPAGGITPQVAQQISQQVVASGGSAIDRIGALLQGIANVVGAELTYQGKYRSTKAFLIPKGKTNFPIEFGWPVRLFRLVTPYPITIRLNDTTADEILLDYQTTPFNLKDLPAGLAFSTIYVTNPNNTDITIEFFAMG